MSSAAAKPQDPSMEDILASIRRIIADDQDGSRAAAPAPESPPMPHRPEAVDTSAPEDEILDLAEIAESAPAFAPAPDDFAEDVSTEARADERHAEPHAPAEAAHERPGGHAQPLQPGPGHAEPLHSEPVQPRPAHAEPAHSRPVQPEPVQATAEPVPGNERLLSTVTDAAVSHAFNMLAHTVFSQNAMTLEDVVKDMLKPLLKEWLDDNLPTLVERLVRSEIERVARGGRR
jgi:cell pole-organizing protein PopZ